MVCWLAFVGLYVTLQLAAALSTFVDKSTHELGTKAPVLSELLHVTVPAGVDRGAAPVSETVAVQVVESPAWNELGVHVTSVFVVRAVTSIMSLPVLPACTE